jgi:hypothetical protein
VDRLIRRPVTLCLLLVALTTATFSVAFRGAFQYDDLYAILINPHLRHWQMFVGHLDHMVRPVLHGTFLLDRLLYNNNPVGYHLLNLLLHLGSGCLVYWILSLATTHDTRYVPFWTSLLFLIHPLQTETVTYISGRSSGLMGFFYLLSFFFFVKAQGSNHTVNHLYLSGALTAYVLSLGSKETAMTFPLVLVLWDTLVRRLDGAAFRKTFLLRHMPFWIVLLAVAAWAWWHPRYRELAQFSLDIRPFWDNLLSQAHATAYALMLFFCPWKQNFDHDLPELHSLFQWPVPLDVLILGGVTTVAIVGARRLPLATFGLGWFFIQLLPTAVIPRNDLLSERNLYLASFGLFLATVVLSTRLVRSFTTVWPPPRIIRVTATSLAFAVIVGLCAMTFQRNAMYRDPVLLWSDTVKKSPHKGRPRNNLGHAYALRDDWERAIEEFRIAVQLDPDYAFAKKNLRDAYLHQVGRL